VWAIALCDALTNPQDVLRAQPGCAHTDSHISSLSDGIP
jgi:hypothetical protein